MTSPVYHRHNLGMHYHEMRKINQTHWELDVPCVTKNCARVLGSGAHSKNWRVSPNIYPHLEAPRCVRYASGETNGESAECFFLWDFKVTCKRQSCHNLTFLLRIHTKSTYHNVHECYSNFGLEGIRWQYFQRHAKSFHSHKLA